MLNDTSNVRKGGEGDFKRTILIVSNGLLKMNQYDDSIYTLFSFFYLFIIYYYYFLNRGVKDIFFFLRGIITIVKLIFVSLLVSKRKKLLKLFSHATNNIKPSLSHPLYEVSFTLKRKCEVVSNELYLMLFFFTILTLK